LESQFTQSNGYQHDIEVIYGDTDSVMVKFGVNDLKETMRLGICRPERLSTFTSINIYPLYTGKEAADYVTAKFIKPINLEFEKIYYPYLLISKKRYAGLYWTRPEKWDKLDTKGIEVGTISKLDNVV